MKRFFFLIVLLAALHTHAQQSFSLIRQEPCGCTHVSVDELGNLYFQGPRFIERRNAVGGGSFRNSELQWGDYESIDLTDPLRPFIHFPATGKLVFWDNTLSMQGSPVDLFEQGFDQIELACGSRGDAFWLWDSRQSELLRVDRTFQRLSSSGNLSVLLGFAVLPVQLIERGSNLYVRTSDHRVLIFDIYGAFKKQLQPGEIRDMQVVHDRLYLITEKEIQMINTVTSESAQLPLPLSDARFYASKGMLYAVKAGVLYTFKFPETARN